MPMQCHATGGARYIPVVSIVTYIIFFSIGQGPIPWVAMVELQSPRTRNLAVSIATGINWLSALAVGQMFPILGSLFGGDDWVMWLFGLICLLGWVATAIMVPETKGVALEDMPALLLESAGR